MELAEWEAAGRFFEYRGQRIFYRDEGKGPVLLAIHGFPTASWDWQRIWPGLIGRFRVIAPDMIGFGFSAKPYPYEYSILDQADLIEGLLQSLGVASVDVLAHDYGDTVAQELLARFEDRKAGSKPGLVLRSLCLLNGGLFPETHRALLIQKVLVGPLGPAAARLLFERGFRRNFRSIFGPDTQPSDGDLADFWSLIERNQGPRVFPFLIRYMTERKLHRERWVGALQKTAIPLRLIDGAFDPISGAHMADRYRELVPNPDVVMLPRIGHYPQVEAPEAVLRGLLEFVPLVE